MVRTRAPAMPRCEDVDMNAANFNVKEAVAPRLAGTSLRLFVWILETRFVGPLVVKALMHKNGLIKMFRKTNIPEEPMFMPRLPDELPTENAVRLVPLGSSPAEQVHSAMDCLSEGKSQNREALLNGGVWRRWTIRDYHNAYLNGRITPTEVAERLLRFCDKSSLLHHCDTARKDATPMNYLIQVDPDNVLKQAEESTQRFKSGSPLSVLDGVPIAVKDEIDCLPYETSVGTTWIAQTRKVQQDAICVARLRECGVVIVGKTNMQEIGMGTTGLSTHFGTPRNPYDTSRYTGGSSSGSAAVVSAGIVPAALGADAGGSIRIPACLCGVVGLKPTFGRISGKGSFMLCPSVCVIGPICGTVEDTLIMYAALAGGGCGTSPNILGSHPEKPLVLPSLGHLDSTERCTLKALEGIRIGKYNQWFNTAIPEVLESCESALKSFVESYNAQVVDIVIPELNEMLNAHRVTVGSECRSMLNADYDAGRRTDFSHEVRLTLTAFQGFATCDYLHAQQIRTRCMHFHLKILQDVDIIVTPTTRTTAPKIPKDAAAYGESNLNVTADLMSFIVAPNFIGLPAISVPVGHDKDGLPIGLQVIGRPWAEATLLQVAAAVEALQAPVVKAPDVFFDVLTS